MYSSFGVLGFCSILAATMHLGFRTVVVGLLFSVAGVAIAREPLKIQTDQPASFDDVKKDSTSIDNYLKGAQCGGWLDVSIAGSQSAEEQACQVVFRCGANTANCQGITGGFMNKKQADGTIVVDFCLPSGFDGREGLESIYVHELTHAKQACPLPPGTNITPDRATCCQIETEAYTAQCQSMANRGAFNTAAAIAAGLTLDTCIQYGVNEVSCSAYAPQACFPVTFPPAMKPVYENAVFGGPGLSCNQIQNNPPPAVKSLLDEIAAIKKPTNPNNQGKIATVTNAPGHSSVWNGNTLSGMGKRNDEFQFPETAVGLTTVCEAKRTQIPKAVWRAGGPQPNEVTKITVNYPNPYFEDPSCRWRIKINGQFSNSAPHVPLQDNEAPPNFAQLDQSPDDRQSPSTCNGFCGYLNTWQYQDCMETAEVPVVIADPNRQTYTTCLRWASKYLCTDQEVKDAASACSPGSDEPANSVGCSGQTCRCQENDQSPLNGCKLNPTLTQLNPDPVGVSSVYYSYARVYNAKISRAAVNGDGPADNTLSANPIPVACYGFYEEFDPKTKETKEKDRRCVINVDVSKMVESQVGKGEYGEQSNVIDADPVAAQNQRTKADTAKDAWYMKLGWGFSLLNEESFEKDYQKNLSNAFLDTDSLDNAKLTGSWPVALSQENPRLANSDVLRAFDDTAEKRTIVSWWQKQQTEVGVAMHPPVIRLLLPASYAFSQDPSDPLFSVPKTVAYDPYDKRNKRIELQIDAQEDTLGQVLNAVKRSLLLQLEEDPVPVVVPLGSATEFRARAEAWCTWWMQKSTKANCDDAPQDVLDLMKKLEEYADRIEDVRSLRTALATYAGKVLQLQQELQNPIQQWITDNLGKYQQYSALQKKLAQETAAGWLEAQTAMTTFTDKTNLPWCMNQRYTAPVYSLLDNDWLKSRANNGNMDANGLPNLTIPRVKDIIIDFSGISFLKDPLTLPVLKPVQVQIDIPSPPAVSQEAVIEKPLPDLPSMKDIQNAMEQSMSLIPKVKTSGTYPPLALPTIDETMIATVKTTITQIKDTVKKMDERYDKFWKSIGPLSPNNNDTSRDGIKSMKEKLECKSWDDPTCQHVEMDLMERLQRIASRKLIMLLEDYDSQGMRRGTPNSCLPSDPACQLIHGETTSTYRWQIDGPKTMPDLGSRARELIRDATLPNPVGTVNDDKMLPYSTDVKSLLPIFDVPKAIDLFPENP